MQPTHSVRGFAAAMLAGLATVQSALTHDAPSPEVARICNADQADRDPKNPDWNAHKIDWTRVRPRDAQRRQAMLLELRAAGLRSGADYACAGLVFQHGDSVEDAQLAHAMFTLAATLDPETEDVRYFEAASWDRLMMRMNRPQWYGTQFVRTPDGGWALADIDETAVTDEDRAKLGVDPIAESRREVERLNAAKRRPEESASDGRP